MKTLLFFLFIQGSSLLACPGCAGSMANEKDNYVVLALVVFIVFTYIPFYLLYSTLIKNRNINNRNMEK